MSVQKEWPEELPEILHHKSHKELEMMLEDYWRSTGMPPNMNREKVQKRFLNFSSNAPLSKEYDHQHMSVSLKNALISEAKKTLKKKTPKTLLVKKNTSQWDKLKSNHDFIKLSKLSKEGKSISQLLKSINKKRRKKGLPDIQLHQLPRKEIKIISQADLKRRRLERIQNTGISTDNIGINSLNWEVLPQGCDWHAFEKYCERQIELSKDRFLSKEVEEAKERFKCIFELRPKEIYQGRSSFSNYFALHFEECEEVVLESVVYGNAIYIVTGDWRLLSQKTKGELKKSFNPKVIPHQKGWFSKLKNYLQIGFE